MTINTKDSKYNNKLYMYVSTYYLVKTTFVEKYVLFNYFLLLRF